jgi:hypothetical protein
MGYEAEMPPPSFAPSVSSPEIVSREVLLPTQMLFQKIPWKLTREFPFITSLHRVKLRLKEIKTDFPKTSKEMQKHDEP